MASALPAAETRASLATSDLHALVSKNVGWAGDD